MKSKDLETKKQLGQAFQLFSALMLLALGAISALFLSYTIYLMLNQKPNPALVQSPSKPYVGGPVFTSSTASNSFQNLWKAPDIATIASDSSGDLIRYGRDLIIYTSKYFGPKGSLSPGSTNGLNCQNCHLNAGTAVFGNNYGAVASTYPQTRPRSEKPEDVPFRVNDCFQRSLNGKPLSVDSKEMKAIVAYMKWLGKDVPKGEKPNGTGLIKIAYLDRPADPERGKPIYENQCARCHGNNGEGKFFPDGISYEYPPLWGEHTYNVSAGLFRMEKMARFLKTNMPFGATYEKPMLSDEEAWDLAAYINSQPHPMKRFSGDWPNLISKAIDVPFGPYADGFSEEQHKYGPYKPIIEKVKQLKAEAKKNK